MEKNNTSNTEDIYVKVDQNNLIYIDPNSTIGGGSNNMSSGPGSTVGGGTGLPTQRECLELMDCYGPGKARKFAEICAAVALAGELSIAAALSAGHFTQAHKKFGRKKS